MKIRASALLSASLATPGLFITHAQKTPAPPAAKPSLAKPSYAGEATVFDRLDRVYRYNADGTGSREISGVVEIHDQSAVKALSVLSFPFASSTEHIEIDYVRVRRADGTVIVTPNTDALEQPAPVTREAPFYSDLKDEQVPVRSLREGDLLEYHVTFVRTRAEAPGHFWGNESFLTVSSGLVALSESIELHIPTSAYIQTWSPKYKPTLTDSPTEHIYRWQSSQPLPVAGKTRNELLRLENDPSLGTTDDPSPPHIAWTNFHTWAEVGAWYRTLEGTRTTPDDDVRARVATLIAGKSTPEDKARAIYNFVGTQIRYIGVAFGIGRYQPHEAGDVLHNQYGDCKDKTTLLVSMLSVAGIDADPVLIGAGVAFIPELPTPGAFNHAINLAHVDGHPVWLDSTAEVAPYALLVSTIRGKQALVIPATGEAHLETTPAKPPFPAELKFNADGSLDDKGTSHSHITLDLRGDDEIALREAVRSVSPAQWDQLMQQISQAMSYSGKVTHTEFARPDDTTLPFHAAYDYEREKNGDWDNLRILPQLSPVGMADVDEKDLPVRPIELGTPHTETSHAVMRLPKGWRADLPAAVHAKSAFATLDKTYTFEDGVLTTDRRLVILAPFVPAADWKTYHQWFKDAGLDGENYIQLYRGSSIVGGSSTTFRFPAKSGSGSSTELQFSAHEDNPAAAQLLVEAMKALQANDWDTAKSKLDQAKALTPKDPRLAAGYGILDAHNQKIDNAIADFQQAIAEQPNATRVYRALAQYQLKNGKLDDALLTMRSAIDHNPGDEPSILYLAYLYTQRGDPHAAAAALREGLATLPDDVAIQLRLGDALLQDGKAAEGVPLLKAILETSQDPGQLNDAAYTLANASLELPLAENAVRHALDLFDTASNNGETGPPALARTNLITDTWDTLGWTLYREDKPAEAEPWVRASWRHNNDAEPGYHLALILEALHRPDDAREQIELASAGSTASGAVKHLIQARQKELHADTVKANPTLALQRLRTYNVPRNGIKSSGNGYATVELELTATGTAAVHLIEGDPSLRALYPVIQQLNLDLPFPPGSQAKLLRHGVLSCHSETECQLVLISTADALTR